MIAPPVFSIAGYEPSDLFTFNLTTKPRGHATTCLVVLFGQKSLSKAR
jgi:hypothetical protein